jgi:hypothetical protein
VEANKRAEIGTPRVKRCIAYLLVLVPQGVSATDCLPVAIDVGYVDCEDAMIVPLTVINDHNWDFGPRDYALIYNGLIIGHTSNYIHHYTVGRSAENDNGYIAWTAGPSIKPEIYVRLYDDTIGATVKQSTRTASGYGRGVFFTPDNNVLSSLKTGHYYHFYWRWSVWAAGYATKFLGPGLTGGPIFCPSGSSCYFTGN